MIQVIEKTDPLASLGQSAGTGLSKGLEMLINQKVKDRQKQKLIDMGLSPILLDLPVQIAGPIAKQQMAQKGLLDFLRGGEEPPPVEGVTPPQQVPPGEVPPVEGVPQQQVPGVEGAPPTTIPRATGLKRLSDEELVISAGQGGNVGEIAKAELLRRSQMGKEEARKEEKKGDRHSRISEKVMIEADKTAADLLVRESAADSMKYAIENRDLSYFSRDNLADVTGIEAFRSPEGAVFKFAAKEYFLGSLRKAGARPNRWIEEHISKMFPLIGRSKEANLTVLAAMDASNDVERRRVELVREIAEASEEKYGYVHSNLAAEVMKKLKPYATQRQNQLEAEMKGIHQSAKEAKKAKGTKKSTLKKTTPEGVLMKDTQGRLKRVKKEDVKAAKAANYTLE